MHSRETQRAVLVTGASTGIGAATAMHLARVGYQVFAGVRRDDDGERLRSEARERLTPLRLDVTDRAAIEAAIGEMRERLGDSGLRGLVNNAGISVPGPIEFVPIDRLRTQLEVNVIGQVAVTQACLPLLRRGRGRVVNVGSIAGRVAPPFLGPYAASKHALEAISDALRLELRPWRIHVALIEPGAVSTPIWEKGFRLADEIEAEIPEAGRALYEPHVESARRTVRDTADAGIPAERVARAIEHALSARRPKTRYLLGRDARLQALLRHWLPDPIFDRLVASRFDL